MFESGMRVLKVSKVFKVLYMAGRGGWERWVCVVVAYLAVRFPATMFGLRWLAGGLAVIGLDLISNACQLRIRVSAEIGLNTGRTVHCFAVLFRGPGCWIPQ